MKNSIRILSDLFMAGILILCAVSASCNKIPVEVQQGTLGWSFAALPPSRTVMELPDTDDFILEVRDPDGKPLYEGTYGASPEKLLVDPGSYTVKVVSRIFSAPAFDAPQFGDEKVVVVKSGAVAKAVLNCTQLNAGIRLNFLPEFRERFPSASVSVSSSDGSLPYSYSEKRTAFFKPGPVSVILEDNDAPGTLMTRYLSAREILSVGITCAPETETASGGELTIVVDTARLWNSEDFVFGGAQEGTPGTSPENAYGISQAKEHLGESAVWVTGFIVGGDLSSTKNGVSFAAPFESRTNLVIAARSSVTEKASCLSVQLLKGKIRDDLNLVDHPELLGRKVFLKGNLVSSYYGIPGIQGISEYIIK